MAEQPRWVLKTNNHACAIFMAGDRRYIYVTVVPPVLPLCEDSNPIRHRHRKRSTNSKSKTPPLLACTLEKKSC
jgi:hypothetical protein